MGIIPIELKRTRHSAAGKPKTETENTKTENRK
jgi:hypothetical protein